MDIEKMRAALHEYCVNVESCGVCKCQRDSTGNCYSGSETTVINNYNRVFGALNSADPVDHPAHYETGKFECIDVMLETQGKEAVKAFCVCNAFKYIYRHGNKNGLEDIKKAVWYLKKYIELEEGETDE